VFHYWSYISVRASSVCHGVTFGTCGLKLPADNEKKYEDERMFLSVIRHLSYVVRFPLSLVLLHIWRGFEKNSSRRVWSELISHFVYVYYLYVGPNHLNIQMIPIVFLVYRFIH